VPAGVRGGRWAKDCGMGVPLNIFSYATNRPHDDRRPPLDSAKGHEGCAQVRDNN